ncbi:LysE family translocator [Pseudomonas fuscovaginae UPB0736]|uniref:Threonine/homoserine/homoserine lactone efflux protein n=1 Tax=Pseudomonas asplenii TaxID=53407 RepID=A0A1H6P5I9_9PSED|nr:LysE family translocator [Pseudomonas fuscovaginae]UUQ65024.1 LysE family translocator [Pseudomonas fuscovaginae UPB0736]SEI19673.1 Threonine/homoserine/homoserine lactone efflux protein [Pseudomonas fuscovaginae]
MLSTFPNLLPFLLFAFVASVTPGPNNILVLSNSARHGLMAALPIILGAGAGAALIVLLVGSGVGQSLSDLPRVHRVMQWLGIAWLSLLAWQIFNAPVSGLETGAHEPRRLGLLSAASLQLINPKVWMMALAVVGVFAGNGAERQAHIISLSLAFFLVSLPCMGLWAILGAGSARLLRSPLALQRFNRCMALLLLVSAWLSVLA